MTTLPSYTKRVTMHIYNACMYIHEWTIVDKADTFINRIRRARMHFHICANQLFARSKEHSMMCSGFYGVYAFSCTWIGKAEIGTPPLLLLLLFDSNLRSLQNSMQQKRRTVVISISMTIGMNRISLCVLINGEAPGK